MSTVPNCNAWKDRRDGPDGPVMPMWWLLLCVGIAGSTAEEAPRVRRGVQAWEPLGKRDGLCDDMVTAICQDALGFMWFGTQNGLSRYDGYGFRNYLPHPSAEGALREGYVVYLYPDRHGDLWISTYLGGVDVYDARTDRMRHVAIGPDDSATTGEGFVSCILQDGVGRMWFATGKGLFRRDPDGTVTAYTADPDNPNALSNNFVWGLAAQDDYLWMATNFGGINRLDPAAGQFAHFTHQDGDPRSLSHVSVQSLAPAGPHALWLATYDGLDLFDTVNGEVQRSFRRKDGYLLGDQVTFLTTARDGALWVGSRQGLSRIAPDREAVTHYVHNPFDAQGLTNSFISALYESDDGSIWAGMYAAGVCRLDPRKAAFNHVRFIPGQEEGLGDAGVWSAFEDRDGSLWLGTFGGGLDHMDLETGEVTHFVHDPDNPRGLPDNRVYDVLRDQAGTLWVGTTNGLARQTAQGFTTFRNDLNDPDSISHNAAYVLLEDRAGRFWIGTYGQGLNLMDRENESFRRYLPDAQNPHALGNPLVLCLLEDRDGRLYVGTDAGIDQYDPALDGFRGVRHRVDAPDGLSHDSVQVLVEDDAGDVWVGTFGGGLNRWRLSDRRAGRHRFTHYDPTTGFPGRVVSGIVARGDALMVATEEGLVHMDRSGHVVRVYGAGEGLQDGTFSAAAFLQLADGRLLLGGSAGMNLFDPTALPAPATPLRLRLTGFQLLGRDVEGVAPSQIQRLDLTHRDSVVGLSFSALNYHHPDATRYRYKLTGLHTDWIDLGAEHKIGLSSLPAGRHTLDIEAHDAAGRRAAMHLPVTVRPAPWRTWYAYLAYFVAVLAVLWGVYRMRIARLKARKQVLEALVRKRTEALRQAQEELVATAHRAGRAEVAALLMHNVGNSLNSMSTSVQLLREELDKSTHVDGLAHLNRLIEAHAEPAAFFTQTEKGRRTPEALGKLEAAGKRYVARLREETERLEAEVRKAGALIKSHGDLADSAQLREVHHLDHLLQAREAGWRTRAATLGLTLLTDYQAVPPLRLDTFKLMRVAERLLFWHAAQIPAENEGSLTLRVVQAMDGAVCLQIASAPSPPEVVDGARLFAQVLGTDAGDNLHDVACAVTELGGSIRFDGGVGPRESTTTVRLAVVTD